MDTKASKHSSMEMVESKDFSYCFESSKSSKDIYTLLLQVEKWWTGFYGETLTGKSETLGDEFEFLAGAHDTKQKLIELVPNKKIVWEVIDCTLQFVTKQNEWVGTKIGFQIDDLGSIRTVTFKHSGLTPKLECFGNCSGAWTEYMNALERKLK